MKLVADEGIDLQCVKALREAGHEIVWIAELQPGAPDAAVLQTAAKHQAPLLTFDKDFGYLVFMQGRAHSGVLLIRLGELTATERAAAVSRAISAHGDALGGNFAVLSSSGLRVRGADKP